MESDVIQQHYADLNLAISENVEVFGAHLVQYGYCTQTAMTNITGTLGHSSYHKASRLLSMVDARIKTSPSKESARKMFDYLVQILAHKLSHYNLAQALVDSCSKCVYIIVHVLCDGYFSVSMYMYICTMVLFATIGLYTLLHMHGKCRVV